MSQILKYLLNDWKCFGPIFLAMAIKGLLAFGNGQWAAAFFSRTHGWSGAKYGLISGPMHLVLAPLGLVLGGMLADRWAKHYRTTNAGAPSISERAPMPPDVGEQAP